MDLCKLDIVVEVATMALKVVFFMSRRNQLTGLLLLLLLLKK